MYFYFNLKVLWAILLVEIKSQLNILLFCACRFFFGLYKLDSKIYIVMLNAKIDEKF